MKTAHFCEVRRVPSHGANWTTQRHDSRNEQRSLELLRKLTFT
jgi:hypothetical protein